VNQEWVEARISISLPARGRTILGGQALGIFNLSLPFVIQNALHYHAYDRQHLNAFVECIEDQDVLRSCIVTDSTVLFLTYN
jgi:Predicted ATPase of the ABC class